jgi:hypothetical protein
MEGQEQTNTPSGQEGGQTGQVVQQPQIDVAALQTSLQQTLKESLAEMARSAQPAPQPPPDAVRDVLAPYLQPIALQTQHATDAATFYATNPQAGTHSAKIEELARQYPTTPRAQLWQYLKGDDSYINSEVERRMQAAKEAADKAAQGNTVGVGGYVQHNVGQVRQASQLTPDELSSALDGISF